MNSHEKIIAGVKALCDLEHEDLCAYPDCTCSRTMRAEYLQSAKAVLRATDPINALDYKW
jgi:hypothetical protein